MKSRLFLDVVVGQGATILELLASKDQALLIRRNAFLVLDLALYVVDCVRRLHLKGDSLTGDWGTVSSRGRNWRMVAVGGQVYLRVLTKICMFVVVLSVCGSSVCGV